MGNDLSLYTSAQDDFSGMRQQDLIIPRVQLMQAISPQVTSGKWRMGQYIDMVQEQPVVDNGKVAKIVPLMFWLEWIEWNPDRAAPKDKKVLARSTDPSSELAKMAEHYVEVDTPKGKRLRVTEYYNFIVLAPSYTGNYEDAFMINFSKSSHRTGKSWLNKLMKAKIRVGDASIRAPIWAHAWELSTKNENKDGNVYSMPIIGAGEMIPVEVHASVKAISDAMKQRRAEVMAKNANTETDDAGSAGHEPADGDTSFNPDNM